MKKSILFIFTVLAITLNSCTDPDDNIIEEVATDNGKLIVNGVEKKLTKAYIIPNYTGTNPEYNKRRFYFILTNGTVTLQDNNFIYSDNTTQLIDFNMFTSVQNSGSVEFTTYNLLNSFTNVDAINPFIDHSGINTNLVIQNGQFVSGNTLDSDDMTAGQVKINQTNGVYSITFSFGNDDNAITGSYTGAMNVLNYQY